MLEVINDFLSGKVLIVLIVGLGGYFTIRSRFVQFRHFFHMFAVFRDSLKSSTDQLSSFQALMLSLAGRWVTSADVLEVSDPAHPGQLAGRELDVDDRADDPDYAADAGLRTHCAAGHGLRAGGQGRCEHGSGKQEQADWFHVRSSETSTLGE